MKLDETYLRGHFTTKDAKGNMRTYQSYFDPYTDTVKKIGVGWKRKKFRSERQALRFLREKIEKEIFEKPQGNASVVESFGELCDIWLKMWSPTVRQTTVDSQKKLLNDYIFPYIPRDFRLKFLTPLEAETIWADILTYRVKRKGTPLEKATLEKIRSLFRQITFYGFRHSMIAEDLNKAEMKIPASRGIEAKARRKLKFLDSDEVKLVLEAMRLKYADAKRQTVVGNLYLDFAEFMIRNGLRVSEAGLITMEKIDFTRKTLTINEGLIASGRTVGNYVINPAKTDTSNRVIDLDERSMEILRNRMYCVHKRQEEMKKRAKGVLYETYLRPDGITEYRKKKRQFSKGYQETDYIFQTRNGNPVVYHNFNAFMNNRGNNKRPVKCVMDYVKELDPHFTKHVTTHTFRYTHISLLAEANVPIKAIMERVGHSDMKTTLQIYNQVTKSTKEQVLMEINTWNFAL